MVTPLGHEQGALAAVKAREGEREIARERGQAAGRASKHRDSAFVTEVSRWFSKFVATTPEYARSELRDAYTEAFRKAAHVAPYID